MRHRCAGPSPSSDPSVSDVLTGVQETPSLVVLSVDSFCPVALLRRLALVCPWPVPGLSWKPWQGRDGVFCCACLSVCPSGLNLRCGAVSGLGEQGWWPKSRSQKARFLLQLLTEEQTTWYFVCLLLFIQHTFPRARCELEVVPGTEDAAMETSPSSGTYPGLQHGVQTAFSVFLSSLNPSASY